MELNDFVKDFADQFEETDPQEITASAAFHDLDEWDSLLALAVLNMSERKYGVKITLEEMRHCVTVGDLFNVICNKK